VYFELYSPKTIKQISTELTARIGERGTRTRPAIQGLVEKGGTFYLMTQSVLLGIKRTTRLRATMERVRDVTIIRGYVSEGMRPERVYTVIAALAAIGVLLTLQGQVVLGLIVFGLSVIAYVPLVGDYRNSQYMLKELKRLSAAKDRPPTSLIEAQAKAAERTRRAAATASSGARSSRPQSKPGAGSASARSRSGPRQSE
jgi:hypothetical protein